MIKLCFTYNNFKTRAKSWINTKKIHKVIKLNQKTWQKSYIDMNTKLRIEAKNDFGKDFFKLMNNAVFQKNYSKCKKAHVRRLGACNNKYKKKLCQNLITTRKYVFQKIISNRNEKI